VWGRGAHLAVDGGGDGEVPGGVGGHAEAEEGPDAVVVEGGDEDGGGAARAEDVRPRPLVQPVVDVVDVAARATPRVQLMAFRSRQVCYGNGSAGM
jgi:hypothetical protein